MPRLKSIRKYIPLGPVVGKLVKLAEDLLGGGTGALKKKLVLEMAEAILKRFKELDLPIPDQYEIILDELIEQAVALMFGKEGTEAPATGFVAMSGSSAAAAASLAPVRPRRGPKPGTKYNKRTPAVTSKPNEDDDSFVDLVIDDEPVDE